MKSPTRSTVRLTVNGTEHEVAIDNRRTLLDLLREDLGLTGAKKGCDHGQCGACTVLVDGERALSCLRFAVTADTSEVETVEGLAASGNEQGTSTQDAFVAADALQCGYCTPGQIMSALGLTSEAKRGWVSHVTADVADRDVRPETLSRAEIAERLSGNLCRCAAYPQIVDAVSQVLAEEGTR